jgi:hypothetical protein
MNLFTLAELQLKRERKSYTATDIIDYAIKLRHWIDMQERNRKVARNRIK